MIRITQNMMKNDVVYNLNTQQNKMDELQNSLSTGKKVRLPHENPVAATNSMLYRSRITEIRKFIDNIEEGQARLNITEGAVRNVTNILHRLRELAVQAANGTYEKKDREKIAVEVDELLKELVEIANTKFKNESIFGGYKVDRNAFEVLKTKPQFADREVITKVIYRGDIGVQNREIEQQGYAGVNLAGNKVFWATNDGVVGGGNVANYVSSSNQIIRIDGKEITINAGDNINTIINKINSANIPVQASLSNNRLVLQTTNPHELWLEDIAGGTFFQQVGIKDPNQAPNETATSAQRLGMSLFDVVIKIRDDLWKNDIKALGGEDLGYLDAALDNNLKNLAEIGARSHRFETVMKRLNDDKVDMLDILSKTENIDYSKVIMDLQMIDHVHRAALAVGARIMRPTLIDFLR